MTVGAEAEGLDEEFVFHLTRGAQQLARGEVDEARAALEQALALQPRDPKALGLLGQALYRQGWFEQAAEAWRRLVEDNPAEAGARVNLGLACLKAGQLGEAVRQLELALDLSPGHQKAMGYLGLALLESGDAGRAREWFDRAGSAQMVARCDEVLAAQARAAAEAPPAAPEPLQALSPLLTAGVPDSLPVHEAPATEAPTGEGDGPPAAGAAPGAGGAPSLAAWAAARVRRPPPAEPFTAEGPVLTAAVHGALLCRLDGLLAWRGDLTFTGEVKRFRGRATDKPFGEGAGQLHRLAGEGLALLRAAGRRFTVLELAGEAAFFREAVVFGLEEAVAFENGRLAAPGGDVELVHLRGRGLVVLATAGEPLALEVTAGAPVRVPGEALVGWVGALTPRLVAPAGGAGGGAVELGGEGLAIVDGGREEPEGA